MHFFLNISHWSPKYGWCPKPNYNYVPAVFQAAWIAYGKATAEQYERLFSTETKWPPNMGSVIRRSDTGERLQNNPDS